MSSFQRPGETPQKAGRRFEAFWASLFGVKPIKGSGSLWYAKLDVADGGSILWSCKHTDNQSFRISSELMQEAQKAILGQGGVGGDTIPGIATSVDGEVYVTLRAEDFLKIFQEDSKWIPQSKGEEKRARSRIPALLRDEEEE
jgi:hypothetical protein